jgi:RsmE family RNA methyltransferase
LDEIIFRPSERSIIKTWNENKSERLQKIAREAVEQSWGRKLPNIEFVTDVRNILKDKSIIVFDKMDNGKRKTDNEEVMLLTVNRSSLTVETFGLVGPE